MSTRPGLSPTNADSTVQAARAVRHDIRNVAIVAHVDHGKTTLVDALLRQTGAWRENQDVEERVLDSLDLEREKGITILAKQTAIRYRGVKINIVDTPGHADFGGEVERALNMVDGVMLLVDAAEGPLPQTRFVLRKTLERALPVVAVLSKMDRSDARPREVLDSVYELFIDLGATAEQIDFPVLYARGREGLAALEPGGPYPPRPEHVPTPGLAPLLDTILEHVPAPHHETGHPFQALVTNLDASPYLGRLAVCRVLHGHARRGDTLAWCRRDGSIERFRATEMLVAEALDSAPTSEVGPGDIVSLAGMAEVTIGETIADADDPRALPLIVVDEPSLSMTIGVNTSPLAGRGSGAGSAGTKLTARQIESRLAFEVLGNVSMRLLPTDRPDTWEVHARGELALAVLVEQMRREGFELTVGKPQVVTRLIDGQWCEPVERLDVDVPEEHIGAVSQALAQRKGRLQQIVNNGGGWARLEYLVPARALIGLRTELLTQTRGTAQLHHAFDTWEPWAGDLRSRRTGSLVADRSGVTTTYAALNLQERGSLFVGPGEEVYEGMIVGESSRQEDMDVNPTKEKKLTNMRSSTAEELVRLTPPRRLSLEAALELIAEDECVEVTPSHMRLRKSVLSQQDRARQKARASKSQGRAGEVGT